MRASTSGFGTKRTKAADVMMSVVEGKADLAVEHPDF